MEPGRGLNRTRWTEFIALLLFSLLAAWMPSDCFAHPCQSVTYCPDIDTSSCCYWYACECHCCVTLARVSSLSNSAEYYPEGDPLDRRFLKIGTVLRPGDHVITGEDSNVILSFEDMSTLMVKAESEVVLEMPPKGPSAIGLVFGKIWVNFKRMVNGEDLDVRMTDTVTGIKGTTVVFEQTKTSSAIKVLEGVVTVTPRRGGAAVSVKAGQMVVTSAGKLSPVGSLNVAAETALWQPLLTAAGLSAPVATPQPQPSPGPTQGNLALGKPARMSSQYSGSYPAAYGVDGNLGSMFHTQGEKNPWWQVDLQGSYALKTIVLHNRWASNGDRARTIQVLLSQDGNAWTAIYRHNGTDFKDLTVDAGGRQARYVRVQLAETNYLHLMEVEVFGSGTAVTRPQPAPTPVQPVQKFNNYNSNVECSYTDKATFILKEPIHVTQAALWYDFGSTQNVTYTLMASGKRSAAERSRKGIVPPVIPGAMALWNLATWGRGPIPWSPRPPGFATTLNTMQVTASS